MRVAGLIRRRRPPPEDLDAVAAALERLAALAEAGATPASAFRYLSASSEGPLQDLALAAAGAARAGRPLGPVFGQASPVWRRAGAVIALAVDAGAPLAPVLRSAAGSAASTVELQRVVAESAAGPAASARLVLLLPPAALLLGWAFGFDVPGVLLGDVSGLVLLVAGCGLLTGAAVWSRRLVRAASAMSWSTGLRLELVATAVRAGLPVPRACAMAEVASASAGIELDGPAGLDDVVRFAAEAGLPVVVLLEAEADRLRRGAIAAARVRATVLAARLLLPLGLLVLPAFLLLGALPIGIAVLRSSHLVF